MTGTRRAWRVLAIGLPIVAVLLAAGGFALGVWWHAQGASFGWYAYAPLSDTRFVAPEPVVLVVVERLAFVAAGLVLVVWALVLLLRRRFPAA